MRQAAMVGGCAQPSAGACGWQGINSKPSLIHNAMGPSCATVASGCADLQGARQYGADMSKPVIFTISAAWDQEASVWSGHCDDIPAAADAPTLDELLAKISAMALDLLPDNHPEIDPASLFLQITALREAEPAAV